MKTLVTKSFAASLIIVVLFTSIGSGALSARETLWFGKAPSTVGSPAATITWDLPWGLVSDPAAVNIWTYPGDAVAVTLSDVEWSMPSGLLIWHYGGPTEGWRFYKKGWGAVNTLTALVPGEGYIGIVPTASVWQIRHGSEASATIGPEGGTIEVTDPSSPLYGLKVDIPEGALTESTVIGIDEENDPPPLSPEIVPVGVVVRLSPDGIRFNSPVKIRLTYDTESVEAGDFVVPLIYSESDDYWYVPYVVDIDRSEGMVEIGTTHFSHLTIAIIDCQHPPAYDTKFRPQVNGFPDGFRNTGGWCDGMACFCQWLYESHPECNGIHTISNTDAQEIAEAAQQLTYPAGLFRGITTGYRGTFTWDEFLCVAQHEMSKSGLPTVIARWSTVEEGKEHALLAYRYDGDVIWYYNVNYPGQEKQLTAAEYNQADIDYAVMDPSELYAPTDFEKLFDNYKDVLCPGGPGETWCFTFYNRLPVVYLYGYPVEIYYVDEDYPLPEPGGTDIDFNEILEVGDLGQLWYAPVPGEPVCIQVTRDGDNIWASFEFIHEPTGYPVSAELSGTIIDNAVSFSINCYLPDGLRNYSMPLNYSDCMSDVEGTVYYSLPAVLTVNYQGTIVGGTIQGAFQAVIAGQWARWRFHDEEYSCAWGTTREELMFDGIVEWTFSNLRLSGDFRVDIGS